MASVIPYLTGGETITPTEMNALYASFDSRLSTILGGRSFLLAAVDRTAGDSQDNGQFRYSAWPERITGKPFLFLSGASAYAKTVPGYKAKAVTVLDPVTATNVSATGGY